MCEVLELNVVVFLFYLRVLDPQGKVVQLVLGLIVVSEFIHEVL
jgi:hypothetical protein